MFENILNDLLKNEPKGKFPKINFHGGCNGCRMQNTFGTLLCPSCCYYEANWNKPNLNGQRRRVWWWKQKIKFFSMFASKKPVYKPGDKPIIFHGGCHGCQSQQTYGIGRCTGCQFYEANWSLPDLRFKL